MKEYIPQSLRDQLYPQVTPDMWAVGVEDDTNGGYGMTHGPFNSETEALNVIGAMRSRIIHFFKNSNRFEVVWRWHNDRWIKVEPIKNK